MLRARFIRKLGSSWAADEETVVWSISREGETTGCISLIASNFDNLEGASPLKETFKPSTFNFIHLILFKVISVLIFLYTACSIKDDKDNAITNRTDVAMRKDKRCL